MRLSARGDKLQGQAASDHVSTWAAHKMRMRCCSHGETVVSNRSVFRCAYGERVGWGRSARATMVSVPSHCIHIIPILRVITRSYTWVRIQAILSQRDLGRTLENFSQACRVIINFSLSFCNSPPLLSGILQWHAPA